MLSLTKHEWISKSLSWFRDNIFAPPFCYYCKKFIQSRTIFCDNCFAAIKPIVSQDIQCGSIPIKVLAIADYQEPLKSLIIAKSWSDTTAGVYLAQLIWQLTPFKHIPCDVIVPVPLHWWRYARRGYNQAEVMGQFLAEKKECEIISLVKRVTHTPFQSSLPIAQRADNVKSVFALAVVKNNAYQGKHIVIVDDLMTTGSTIQAVAKTLLPLKPASITALVASRVI